MSPKISRHQPVNNTVVQDLYLAHAQVQRKLAEAEKIVLELQEESRCLLSLINAQNDPLQNIPPELLSHIFENIEPTSSKLELAFALGSVCHHWRQLVWSTPSLWNEVNARPCATTASREACRAHAETTRAAKFDLFRECIERSGELPLMIQIDSEMLKGQISTFMEYIKQPAIINRVVSADFHMFSNSLVLLRGAHAPNIKKLVFRTPETEYSQSFNADLTGFSKKLEELRINSFNIEKFNHSLEKLAHMDLSNSFCPPQVFVDILQQIPNIRDCRVRLDSYPHDNTPLVVPANILLTYLTHLSIYGDDGFNQAFDALTTPALVSLSVDTFIDHDKMLALFKRSHCPLTTLTFSTGDRSDHRWTPIHSNSLLDQVPSLNSLIIEGSLRSPTLPVTFLILFSSSLITSPRARISKFSCSYKWKAGDDWSFIVELFEEADTCSTQAVDIDLTVYFKQPSEYEKPIPIECLRVIQRLELQGWKWSIRAEMDCGPYSWRDLVSTSIEHYDGLQNCN